MKLKIKKNKKRFTIPNLKNIFSRIDIASFLIEKKFYLAVVFLPFLFYVRTVFFEVPYGVWQSFLVIGRIIESGATLNVVSLFLSPNDANVAPLLYLLYVSEVFVFGLNYIALHLVTILIFSIASFLVFDFLKRFMSDSTAFFSTVLFIVHPFMIEVVIGIEGGGVLMALIFFIFSFNFFFFYNTSYKLFWSSLFFILSLLSSFYGMFLPFLILFYGYSFTEDFKFKKALPLIAILFLYIGYIYILALYPFSLEYIIKDVPVGSYLMTTLFAATFYMVSFLYPVDIMFYQSVSLVDNPSSMDFIIALQSVVLLIFISLVTYRSDKKFSFALFILFCSIFPISHLLPQPYFISYTMSVFSLLAFALIFGKSIDILIERVNRKHLIVVYGFLFFVGIFFIYNTIERSSLWKDNKILLEESVVNSPEDFMLRFKLGQVYEMHGEYNNALFEFEKSVKYNMKFKEGYYAIARMYSLTGDFDLSFKALKWAVASGFKNKVRLSNDPYFEKMRDSEEFREILELIDTGIGH